jgi:energy-coupling factor transport system ATP-binding protein
MHEDGTFATAPLSFSLAPGDRVLLSGRSGAGKSTLLAALAGIDVVAHNRPDLNPGTLLVNGRPPAQQRGHIGFVLQDPYSQAVMERVGDDVAFGLENIGVAPSRMRARIADALADVGLNVEFERPTESLSGGERQRLALAGVLALRPSLLLLDEPTANLDPRGAQLVRDSVARIARERGLTLIVVDHHPNLWAGVVTRELLLDERGITEQRKPRRLSASGQKASAKKLPSTKRRVARTTTSAQPALTTRDLAAGYPGGQPAQQGISLEAFAGSILAITGENGVGKSALALTLGGLIPPISGDVTIIGDANVLLPAGDPHTWKSKHLTKHVGSVFQAPEHQFVGATVRADVAAGLNAGLRAGLRAGKRASDARLFQASLVDSALVEFNLHEHHDQNPFTLSGGEKRRLSIADAVVMRPRILIFDEPTFGQDEHTRDELITSFRRLRDAGHALIVVTHDERFVAEVADRHVELVA